MARRRAGSQPLICAQCHVPNTRDRQYCYNCGAELPQEAPQPSSILRVPMLVEIAVIVVGIGVAVVIAVLLVMSRIG